MRKPLSALGRTIIRPRAEDYNLLYRAKYQRYTLTCKFPQIFKSFSLPSIGYIPKSHNFCSPRQRATLNTRNLAVVQWITRVKRCQKNKVFSEHSQHAYLRHLFRQPYTGSQKHSKYLIHSNRPFSEKGRSTDGFLSSPKVLDKRGGRK